MDGTRFVETDFWVLPDMKALHGLINNSSI